MPSARVSSRSAPTALPSVSERRSRRARGAVLWETPRARSSLISSIASSALARTRRDRDGLVLASASGGDAVNLGACLREPRQLPQLPLDPLQAGGHDRDVDDDQNEEDDV